MQNILIVDSDPDDLTILQEMLEEKNYHFVTASSGHEAKDIVTSSEDEVAAVLIDWILPDVDAMELLSWMKSQERLSDVEIVVHSAEFSPEYVERGIESGAYYYLTKPFEEPQLEAIMRSAIRSYELKRRLTSEAQMAKDAFRLLDVGRFRFRRLEEADLLATHIASACGTPEASLGLRELLVNAVEHGNLGITYEDKSRLLANRELDAERRRRLTLPEYRDRRVEITLQQLPGRMEVTIKDEGPGFDYERFMVMDEQRLFDDHGRGVLMASSMLELEYMHPGNHVRVRLPIRD